MTPREFVAALKRSVRQGAAGTIDYISCPPVTDPPNHLGEFSRWFQGLTEGQRATAARLVEYAAEGSLFDLLTVLDNITSLDGQRPGRFELFHVESDSRTLLNDAEGDLLYDLFNEAE